jgi:CheY-like chemotaxis protein
MTDPALKSLAGIQILVVEDHDDSRDFLQQVLTHAGASVKAAASAREASLALDDADLVITDYAMPGDAGLWLLERVRERPRPVPVIVLTGYADLHSQQLAKAPFASVLRKPVDPWHLCEIAWAVLRGT